jgi:hypothetical protein
MRFHDAPLSCCDLVVDPVAPLLLGERKQRSLRLARAAQPAAQLAAPQQRHVLRVQRVV